MAKDELNNARELFKKKWKLRESPDEKIDFLIDIVEVYKKHGLALGHEDFHGGFIIEKYDDSFVYWLNSASWHDDDDIWIE
ncbi:MAG: hypothetical protein ACRCWR_02585 [Saezia sp.]